MKRSLISSALAASLVALTALQTASAQLFPRGNGLALVDVDRFDMYVQILDWVDIEQDETTFRLSTLKEFEEQLAEVGIRRQAASRDYLVCALQARQQDNEVTYSTSLEYWQLESTGPHRLIWQQSRLAGSPARRFDAERVAADCAGVLIAEWQRWNNT